MFSTRVSFALFACVALLAVTPVIADTDVLVHGQVRRDRRRR